MQSLLLGLRGGITPTQRKILSESGIAHLFAISGLHFGLLAVLFYRVGRWLYTRNTCLLLRFPPQRILPVLLLVPLAGYLIPELHRNRADGANSSFADQNALSLQVGMGGARLVYTF